MRILKANQHPPWWVAASLAKIKDARSAEAIAVEIGRRIKPIEFWFAILRDLGPVSYNALFKFLKDENAEVRRQAALALLGASFQQKVNPELINHLTRYLRNEKVSVLKPGEYLGILLRIGDPRYAEFLPNYFILTNGEVEESWLQNLWASPFHASIVKNLIDLRSHQNEFVRTGALSSLKSRWMLQSTDRMIRDSDVIAVIEISGSDSEAWRAKTIRSLKATDAEPILILRNVPSEAMKASEMKGSYLAFLKKHGTFHIPYGAPGWRDSLLEIESKRVTWPDAGSLAKTPRDLDSISREIAMVRGKPEKPKVVWYDFKQSWDISLGDAVSGTPLHTDLSVIVPVSGGRVQARNVSDGKLIWKSDSGGIAGTSNHVNVFVTGSKSISALDLKTGKESWRFEPKIPGSFPSAAVLDGSNLYVALIDSSRDFKDMQRPANLKMLPVIGREPRHFLFSLDPATGKEKWRVEMRVDSISFDETHIFTTGGYQASAISKTDRKVVWSVPLSMSGAERIHSFKNAVSFASKGLASESGAVLWESQSYSYGYRAVLAGGTLYTSLSRSETEHAMAALDPLTGDLRWRFQLPSAIRGGAAVTDDSVFFTAWDNSLYVLDRKSGDLKAQFPIQLDQSAPVPIITKECILLAFKNKLTCVGHGSI
jgi:outer membrane protein assembly factor BamB